MPGLLGRGSSQEMLTIMLVPGWSVRGIILFISSCGASYCFVQRVGYVMFRLSLLKTSWPPRLVVCKGFIVVWLVQSLCFIFCQYLPYVMLASLGVNIARLCRVLRCIATCSETQWTFLVRILKVHSDWIYFRLYCQGNLRFSQCWARISVRIYQRPVRQGGSRQRPARRGGSRQRPIRRGGSRQTFMFFLLLPGPSQEKDRHQLQGSVVFFFFLLSRWPGEPVSDGSIYVYALTWGASASGPRSEREREKQRGTG